MATGIDKYLLACQSALLTQTHTHTPHTHTHTHTGYRGGGSNTFTLLSQSFHSNVTYRLTDTTHTYARAALELQHLFTIHPNMCAIVH